MLSTPTRASPLDVADSLADSPVDAHVETQIRRFRNALGLGLAIFVLSELGAALSLVSAPEDTVRIFFQASNPFLASGILGSFVIFVATRPGWRAGIAATACGILLEVAAAWWRAGQGQPPVQVVSNVGAGLGAAALVANGVVFARASGAARRERLSIWLASAVTPTFLLLAVTFLEITVTFHPLTLDQLVYHFDAAFGGQASFTFAVWLGQHPAAMSVVNIVYAHLPAAFAVVFALETRNRVKGNDVLSAFLFAGFLGFACYHFMPLVGPRFAFPEPWPHARPENVPLERLRATLEYRNCVPSLHTSWALLLYWYARPLGRLRYYAAAWLLVTLFATLSLGFHFVLDLVIAVPFSVFVQGLATNRVRITARPRQIALAWGGSVTAAWFLFVRFGVGAAGRFPWLICALATVTVIASFVFERNLAERKESEEPPVPAVVPWREQALFFASAVAGVFSAAFFITELGLSAYAAIVPMGILAVGWGAVKEGRAGVVAAGGSLAALSWALAIGALGIAPRIAIVVVLDVVVVAAVAIAWRRGRRGETERRGEDFAFGIGIATGAIVALDDHLLRVAMPFESTRIAAVVGLALALVIGNLLPRGSVRPRLALGLAWTAAAFLLVNIVGPAMATFFGELDGHPPTRTFVARTFVRLSIGIAVAALSSLGIGAALPSLAPMKGRTPLFAIAGVTAGALVVRFGVARLGSFTTAHVLAVAAGLAAVVLYRRAALALLPAAVLTVLQPPAPDLERLASGTAISFSTPEQDYGPVDEAIEDVDRGLTTLHHQRDGDGELTRALVVNGVPRTEPPSTPPALGSPALVALSLRHARPVNRALVIGLGDFATLRLLEAVTTLDIVEPNRDVATLARHAGENRIEVADARTFLDRTAHRYDLVVLDAGGPTDAEPRLFALAKGRLSPAGVFAQRVMLASLDEADVRRWVGAARRVFSRVWIYASPRQALLVGCEADCSPTPNDATAFLSLGPDAVDRLIAAPPSAGHFAEAPWPDGAAGEPFVFFQRFVDP